MVKNTPEGLLGEPDPVRLVTPCDGIFKDFGEISIHHLLYNSTHN